MFKIEKRNDGWWNNDAVTTLMFFVGMAMGFAFGCIFVGVGWL